MSQPRSLLRFRSLSRATALAACLVLLAPVAPAAAQGRIVRSTATTGAFDLAAGNVAKLYLIDFGASRIAVPATLELFDVRGRRVAIVKATVRPGLRPLRNLVLSTLARLPRFRRRLAWRLSGLVYR